MNKELVNAFILECKLEKELKERWRANHIEFDNYFKYSGKTEPNTPQYEQYLKEKEYDHRFAIMPVMDKIKYLQDNIKLMQGFEGETATFTYFERTKAGSYRHPLFKCIRNYE